MKTRLYSRTVQYARSFKHYVSSIPKGKKSVSLLFSNEYIQTSPIRFLNRVYDDNIYMTYITIPSVACAYNTARYEKRILHLYIYKQKNSYSYTCAR